MTRPYELYLGDCREMLTQLDDSSVDSIVTDPPYELGFMGKTWDSTGIANNSGMWAQCLRVLKPGGHLLAFSGSRTYHRMVCAIEDGGFEIRDQIMWIYGSGFPKSRNLGDGLGTALKPAHEPICVARKPFKGTVAANVLAFGTGALNIDACRIDAPEGKTKGGRGANGGAIDWQPSAGYDEQIGRWPANVIHDGSPEVLEQFPYTTSGAFDGKRNADKFRNAYGAFAGTPAEKGHGASEGSAARFFYCAKASRTDRNEGLDDPGPVHKHGVTLRELENAVRDGVATGNTHPTVKPSDLMAYLCRLVTPPGGLVFDPFMGSGSTGKAAVREGFSFIGIDMTPEYVEIASARIDAEIAKRDAAARLPKQTGLFEMEIA